MKEADKRLAELGGCARFGMDDSYMIGPPEMVFKVLAEFAAGVKELRKSVDASLISSTARCTTRRREYARRQ